MIVVVVVAVAPLAVTSVFVVVDCGEAAPFVDGAALPTPPGMLPVGGAGVVFWSAAGMLVLLDAPFSPVVVGGFVVAGAVVVVVVFVHGAVVVVFIVGTEDVVVVVVTVHGTAGVFLGGAAGG